jgi:hypothetical protein
VYYYTHVTQSHAKCVFNDYQHLRIIRVGVIVILILRKILVLIKVLNPIREALSAVARRAGTVSSLGPVVLVEAKLGTQEARRIAQGCRYVHGCTESRFLHYPEHVDRLVVFNAVVASQPCSTLQSAGNYRSR